MERHNRDEMLFSSPLTAQEAPPEKKRKIEPSNCGANGSMTSMKPRPPNLIPDPPEFRHYGNHYGESSWNKDSFRALLENNDLVDPNLDKGFKNSRHGGPGAYSRGGSLGEQPSAPTSPYEVPFIMDNKPISSQAPMQDLLSFNARAFSEFHTLNTEMTGKERTPSESIEKSKPVEPVETRKPVEPVKSVLTPIRSSLPLTSSPQANVACSTTEPAPQDQVSSSCKTTETSRPETSTSATSEETNSTINHTESTKEPEGTPSNEVKVKQEDASLPMKKSENKLADKSVDKEADIRATATEAADSTTATESSDPFGCLDWKNGIATLPGSNLKFKMTEFGTLEIVSTVETEKGDSVECSTATDVGKKETEEKDIPKTTDLMQGPPDESQVLCCEVCGVYGLPQDFCASGRFCSLSCVGKNTGRLNKGREIIRNATSVEGKLTKKKKKVRGGRRKNSPSLMDDDDPPYGEPISPKLKGVKPERGRGKPKAPMAEAKGTSLTASMVPYNFSKPFTWADYLYTSGAKPVPVSTFRQENPDIEVFTMPCEEFKKNMKLEAVDPKHPSYICVCTIVRVKGARLRLHFDGWSECYDFWTNADSPFIFPVGWCAKNGQVLHPQRGVLPKDFNWEKYLKKQNATAAPEHLFTPVSPTKHGFKTGMKLEAIDRKNPDLICVATVTNVIGNRFLVHFDEWDDTYDYWCEEDCPYIHPVGWCSANGGKLNPPNGAWNKPVRSLRKDAGRLGRIDRIGPNERFLQKSLYGGLGENSSLQSRFTRYGKTNHIHVLHIYFLPFDRVLL